jgi:hypothetical protein
LPTPLAHLLEPQIERAMLAYRKRCRSLEHGWQSLRTLGVLEQPIESLLESARYYGPQALARACALRDAATGHDVDAAVFVVTAIEQALDSGSPSADSQWMAFLDSHRRAVRDALWFHGQPPLCDALLAHAEPSRQLLGVELTGRMTQQHLASRIAAMAAPQALKLQTLGLLDASGRSAPSEIVAWLKGGEPNLIRPALDFLLTTGIAVAAPCLAAALQTCLKQASEDELDAACALTCIQRPPPEVGRMLATISLPGDLWLRCVAFLGTPSLLLQAFAQIDRQEALLSREQKNLVLMTLGKIPAELADEKGTQAARSAALRKLAAAVFQRNGCAEVTSEKLAGWPQDLLTGPLWPLEQIRLRAGRPWNKKLDCDLMLEVSHRMRRWLYAEHAAVTGRSFPLAIDDRGARQIEVLETLKSLDELFDLQ